ncbi:MAG: anthranilate synthase component I [Ruminiclostridium sp.]|nr:anthranilate synthase component I [Ruminiclostridium sp.]
MFYPDFEVVESLAGQFNIIPVSMEVYADMDTPISMFKKLENNSGCFLLESVEGGEKWGRYSFMGRNPFISVRGAGSNATISYRDGKIAQVSKTPFEALKDLMASYKSAVLPGMPRFNGGAVGFFGYDTARYFEDLPDIPDDDVGLPELHFMFADEIIAFDHLRQKMHIIVNMHVKGNIERAYNTTVDRIKEVYGEIIASRSRLESIGPDSGSKEAKPSNIQSNISKENFCRNVEKAKEYIRNGDIFQVVLSQRFAAETDSDPFNAYRALRIINPGPYMYYLKFDGYTIAGSSPEMLVRMEDGIVETCPIAGTRKRGLTEEEDDLLAEELLADEKERAEHVMLVDLGRNDIGKVSEFGSVTVKDFMHIERYSHVMHLVTAVQGKLKSGLTAFDALSAVLPAGTLSGAPKIRAMEIIDELETAKRCHYGGAVGYLSFNGNLDSCITIRTILFKNGKAYIQAGCGIVADSDPEKEYEESVNKARAALKALEEAKNII